MVKGLGIRSFIINYSSANLERESQQLSDKLEFVEELLVEKRREEAILSTRLELQAASYEEKLVMQSNDLRVRYGDITNVIFHVFI